MRGWREVRFGPMFSKISSRKWLDTTATRNPTYSRCRSHCVSQYIFTVVLLCTVTGPVDYRTSCYLVDAKGHGNCLKKYKKITMLPLPLERLFHGYRYWYFCLSSLPSPRLPIPGECSKMMMMMFPRAAMRAILPARVGVQ